MQYHWYTYFFINSIHTIVYIDSGVPWPVRGVWESFHSHDAGTFVYPFNHRSGNRRRNLWDRQCVSTWWHLDWFGYLHELYIDIWFTLTSLTDGVWHSLYLHWLMGKGMAYSGLPYLSTGCPVPDVVNIYVIWNVWCMIYCFYNCPPP